MELPNHDELMQKRFGPALAGEYQSRHVEKFRGGDPEDPLAAPITEFATLKLKEGVTLDAFEGPLEKLNDIFRGCEGCYGVVWGECIEHPDTVICIVGWDSVEVCFLPEFWYQY